MPIYIRHRVNQSNLLRDCDPSGGVEIDVRSCGNGERKMHLSHDPWSSGEDLDAWLEIYTSLNFKGPLIVNTKEDGLEGPIAQRLENVGIDNYFFLDTTPPTLARCLGMGRGKHMAVRLSSLEPPAGLEPWFSMAEQNNAIAPGWLWLDCFNGEPLDVDTIREFSGRARTCLVSPELQGQPCAAIEHFTHLAQEVDAVCTKNPKIWQSKVG